MIGQQLTADVGKERCKTCGKRMNGMYGRRRAIVDGARSLELCNLCQWSDTRYAKKGDRHAAR